MNKGELLEVVKPTDDQEEFSWADAELDVLLTDEEIDRELEAFLAAALHEAEETDEAITEEESAVAYDRDESYRASDAVYDYRFLKNSNGKAVMRPDLDLLGTYFKDIRKEPPVYEAEELDLAKKIDAGREAEQVLATEVDLPEARRAELEQNVHEAKKAKDRLVRGNLRLAAYVAKDRLSSGMPYLDLIQDANIGLFKAAGKFDYRYGVPFGKFAPQYIRNAIWAGMIEQSRTIRLPAHVVKSLSKIDKARVELRKELGRSPEPEEIAAKIDLKPEKVIELMHLRSPLSLDAPVFRGNMVEKDGETLGDMIPGQDEDSIVDETYRRVVRSTIEKALDELPEKQAKVIKLSTGWVDGNERGDIEVGKVMKMSREGIRKMRRDKITPYLHGPLKELLQPFAEDFAS